MEAALGVEPRNNSFADCRLSVWLYCHVVGDAGLEPATLGLKVPYSTN